MKLLTGHISPETAYVVEDYPYGFRLRCKKRIWLDYHPRHGVRLVSQTSNPKLPGERWNKPKASPYCSIAAAMYLDEATGYVEGSGLSFHHSAECCNDWMQIYGDGVPAAAKPTVVAYLKAKTKLTEQRQAQIDAVMEIVAPVLETISADDLGYDPLGDWHGENR